MRELVALKDDEIPVKWIEKQIKHCHGGMEAFMWKKLIRMWYNNRMRIYVKELDRENK